MAKNKLVEARQRRVELEQAELESRINYGLEHGGQWVKHFSPSDVDDIAAARSAGRRVGRALGVGITTRQSNPDLRADGQIVVTVFAPQLAPRPSLDAATREYVDKLVADWPTLTDDQVDRVAGLLKTVHKGPSRR